MSAGTGGFRWDDPFRTGTGGQFFDQNTMKGLILRAQRGDRAALNHLKVAGFTDEWGNFAFNPQDVQVGNYDPAVQAWATSKNLQQWTGGPQFSWNQSWVSGDPSFSTAWDQFFSGQPGQQQTTPGMPIIPQVVQPDGSAGHTGGQPLTPGQPQTQQAPAGQGGSHPTLALFSAPATRTRNSGAQTPEEAGYQPGDPNFVPDWSFANGKLRFRISTHPENPQMTVMRFAVGNLQRGMPPEQAYRQALQSVIQTINRIGAADNTFTLYDYSDYVGQMVQHWAQQRYFDRNAWDEAARDGRSGVFMHNFANEQSGRPGLGLVTVDAGGGVWDPTGRGQITNVPNTGAPPGAPPGTPPATTPPAGGTGGGAGTGTGGSGGGGTGGGAGAGGTGGAGGAGGTGGGNSLQNIALFSDPQSQMAELYSRLGIDPLADNVYTNAIVDTLNPVLQAFMDTNEFGTGRPAIDNTLNRIGQLADMMRNGGGGFNAVRNEFRGMLGRPGISQTVNDLGATGARNFLQTQVFGANAGANTLISQALRNRFNRAFAPGVGAYDRYTLQNLGQPTMTPLEWIQQSEWADLLEGL